MNLSKLEIVRNFIEAYNALDIDTMLSLVNPDVHFKNIYQGDVTVQTTGKEEFETLARQSAKLFTERKQTILSSRETDSKVLVEIHFQAITAADLPNGSKRGSSVRLKGMSEYAFKDGLISSITDEA